VKILSDTPNSKTLPLVGARRLSYASIEVAYLTQIPKLGCKIEGFMRRFHLANRTSEKLV
jgi:hypothetical protein